MIDIKRLHRIMEEKGTDPDVTMHDLVREVLKRDYDREDYSLENISKPVAKDEISEHSYIGSTVQKNIEQIEVKFREFHDEDQLEAIRQNHDKESTLFETIERLRSKAKNGWTHLIKARPSNENYEE